MRMASIRKRLFLVLSSACLYATLLGCPDAMKIREAAADGAQGFVVDVFKAWIGQPISQVFGV